MRVAILTLISASLSLLSPAAGLLTAWISVVIASIRSPSLLSVPLLLFSHAGALIFASRSFESASADFTNYFDVFSAFCSNGGAPADGLRAFGLEIGLPVMYAVLSSLGGCGLSIVGLAYFQGLLVSFATLFVMTRYATSATTEQERPFAIGGLCLMYSFFFATQVSRQAASSVFLLIALFIARSGPAVAVNVLLATLMHLTAPVIFAIAVALRSGTTRGLAVVSLLAFAIIAFFDKIVEFSIANPDTFGPLSKLSFYSGELDGGVFSDVQSIVYLSVPALIFLFFRRLRRRADVQREVRLLLGFAVIGLALLPMPLATTRLTLPFGLLVEGYFIFKALGSTSRPLAIACLGLLLALRLGLSGGSGDEEHTLWKSYAPVNWLPGYYFSSF